MAKIRTLKGEYFRNADISRGGINAKVLGAGLITAVADDEGRFKADPEYLRGEVFTHDPVTVDDVRYALARLQAVDFLRLYSAQGRTYGVLTTWKDHQPVPPSRFKESKLPPPPNTKRRRHNASTTQTDDKQMPPLTRAPARAGNGTEEEGNRNRTHGDVSHVGANGSPVQQALAGMVVPPDRQVSALCEWFLNRRGWDSFGSLEVAKHERQAAQQLLSLQAFDQLLPALDAEWPDEIQPSSLEYFWRKHQDALHNASKTQGRSHARTSGFSKLGESLPDRDPDDVDPDDRSGK